MSVGGKALLGGETIRMSLGNSTLSSVLLPSSSTPIIVEWVRQTSDRDKPVVVFIDVTVRDKSDNGLDDGLDDGTDGTPAMTRSPGGSAFVECRILMYLDGRRSSLSMTRSGTTGDETGDSTLLELFLGENLSPTGQEQVLLMLLLVLFTVI